MQISPNHRPWLRFNGLSLGILATLAWMLVSGFCVQSRHDVPSLVAFKGSLVNVTACAAPDVRTANQCLDDHYDHLLAEWRTDTGVAVVLPPMLAWVVALLRGLCVEAGLFRRRQRA